MRSWEDSNATKFLAASEVANIDKFTRFQTFAQTAIKESTHRYGTDFAVLNLQNAS
jgi:hypothetical protein